PDTVTVTSRKGLHYYFKYNERSSVLKTTTNIANCLDIRSDKGLIFGPGSRYPKLNGDGFHEYELTSDCKFSLENMAEIPD
ncbi:bifunctional DNA primase/polymerase, partial [Klebsiella pneumoniae]